MAKTFRPDDLRGILARLFMASGSEPEEAETVAANLVMANLSGHDSHGIGMAPRYVDAVLEKGLMPNTRVKVLLDSGAMLALDAGRAYGQMAGPEAMRMGIERARKHGSCIVSLAHSHHLGRIGHLAEMAVEEGLVSLHFVNVLTRAVVAPWGGGDSRLGTNPCCIGIPVQGRAPFILDFATSRVAQGKMRVAHNKGQKVAPGHLIDAQGRPTNDPAVVVVPQGAPGLFGSLLPFGEHKGSGLAVACELLGGALSGGGTVHGAEGTSRAVINGMLTILIDPKGLGTESVFERDAQAFVDWFKASPAGEGFEGVQLAGEPERLARAKRSADGVVVDDATWAEIVAAGAKVGLTLDDAGNWPRA